MAVMRAAGLVSGETHYAILSRDSDGRVWNGSTWVVYATVDRVVYAIVMTEAGDASGVFAATIPAIDDGAYSYDVYQQLGMIEPQETDTYVGSGAFALPLDGVATLINHTEADREIDTTTTPWQEVVKIRGSATELLRRKLRDTAGQDVAATSQIIGSAKEA